MSEQVGIDLNVNSAAYVDGINSAVAATGALNVGLSSLVATSSVVQRALDQVTPKRAAIAGLTGMAAAAASNEQALSQMRATAAVGGQSLDKLSASSDKLARSLPLGQRGAQMLVGTVQQLGVTGAGSEARIAQLSTTFAKLGGATGSSPTALAGGMAQLERTFGDQGLDPTRVKATGDALTYMSARAGASASSVLDLTNAIGPMAQASGIGKTQAMGISTAMARIGQDGGAAANAVNTMLTGMNRAVRDGTPDMYAYANILGTTADQFQRLYKNNPTEALTQVVESVGKAGPMGQRQLDQLGLDGVRTQKSLQALATSGNLRQTIDETVGAYGNGATDKGAKAGMSGLNDTLVRLQSTSEQVAQAMGRPLLQPLDQFARLTQTATGGLAAMVRGITGLPGVQGATNVAMYGGLAMMAARMIARPLGIGALAATVGGSAPVRGFVGGLASGLRRTSNFGGRAQAMANLEGQPITYLDERGRDRPLRDAQGNTVLRGRNDLRQPRTNPRSGEVMRDAQGNPLFRGQFTSHAFGFGQGLGETLHYQSAEREAHLTEEMRNRLGPGTPEMATWQADRDRLQRANGIGRRFTRGVGSVGAAAMVGLQGYARLTRSQYQAGLDAMRGNELDEHGYLASKGSVGAFRDRATEITQAYQRHRAGDDGSVTGKESLSFRQSVGEMNKALGKMRDEVGQTNSIWPNFRGAVRQGVGALVDTARFGGSAVGRVAGIGARGLAGAAGSVYGLMGGGAGIAMMGGMALLGAYQNQKASNKAEANYWNSYDPFTIANQRADAFGTPSMAVTPQASTQARAASLTQPSVTANPLTGQVQMGQVGSAGGWSVTPQMISASSSATGPPKLNVPKELTGSGFNAAAVYNWAFGDTPNPDPQTMTSRATDLLRTYTPQQVNEILANGHAQAPGDPNGGGDTIASLVNTGSHIGVDRTGAQRFTRNAGSHDSYQNTRNQDTGFAGGINLRQSAKDTIGEIVSNITAREQDQSTTYGSTYATQTEFRDMNQAIAAAIKSGNEKYTHELAQAFSSRLGGGGNQADLWSKDMGGPGGFIAAYAGQNKAFNQTYQNWLGQGGSLTTTGGVPASVVQGPDTQQMSGFGVPGIFPFYDNTTPRPVGPFSSDSSKLNPQQATGIAAQATQTFLKDPTNANMDTAVQRQIEAASKAGISLSDLAAQSTVAAQKIGQENDARSVLAVAVANEATRQRQFQAIGQTPGQAMAADVAANIPVATAPVTDDASMQRRTQSQGALLNDYQQTHDQLQQRLQLIYQYQVQSSRATTDFNTQQKRAQDDFATSQLYAQQDYTKQRTRTEEDYHLSVKRANRDFNTTMARAQDDYFTTRGRAIRDFNKQLKREVEDQTKSLYDPYSRIQTQAVWDGRQLLMNLGEQNAAMKQQSANLDTLRKAGVSGDAIDQLGLTSSQNAQQLAKLVDDITSDPQLAKQINSTVATRLSLGSILVQDPGNKQMQRQKDDFSQQLSDMEVDYKKQINHARTDFGIQMSDQEADFTKGLAHMDADYQQSVARSATAFNLQMSRMTDDFKLAMAHMKEDVDTNTKIITGDVGQLYDALNKTMKGKQGEINKLMKDGLSDTMNWLKDPKNISSLTAAYKNYFPYDLSQFTGAVQQPAGTPANARVAEHNMGLGGPDEAHMPSMAHVGGHGGPYAPYANTAAQQAHFEGNRLGGMGTPVSPTARITQSFGEHNSGDPETGGGWPVPGSIVSQPFGAHNNHDGSGGHPGIDLAVPRGTPISAPLPGIVIYAGWNDGYGNCVIMDNGGGRSTLYGHQQAISAHVGDNLKAGDLIGWVDSTGNSTGDHLHFETRQNGMVVNPADMLPQWQATAGLGSFDPGSTAKAYGVGLIQPHLNLSDYEGPSAKYKGPYAAFFNYVQALKDANAQVQSQLDTAGRDNRGTTDVTLPNPKAGADAKRYAQSLMSAFGWGSGEWDALNTMWTNESGWDTTVHNGGGHGYIGPKSAYGIPQALPGDKMASEGPDWQTNFAPQVRWGLKYIKETYGSPSRAWTLWQSRSPHWYGEGSIFNGPQQIGVGERGPEAVIPLDHRGVSTLAAAFNRAVGADQLRTQVAGTGRSVTYHYETHSYDQSTQLTGPITVQSQDPHEMQRKLDAKARQSRLVGAKR